MASKNPIFVRSSMLASSNFSNFDLLIIFIFVTFPSFKISKDTIELKQDLSAENTQDRFSCKNKVESFNSKYAFESDDILVLSSTESDKVIKINRVK